MSKEHQTYQHQEATNMRAILKNEGTWAYYRGLVMGIDSLDEPVPSPRDEEDEMTRGDLIPAPMDTEREATGNVWVEEMLGLLPERLQTMMRLRMDGYESREIGEMMGYADGTIRAGLTQARRILRGEMA